MTLARRIVLFAVFTVGLLAATFHLWSSLVDFARHNDTATHILLVPFVTAVLLMDRRESLFTSVRSAPFAGSAVIVAGLSVLTAGALSHPQGGSDLPFSAMVAGGVIAWLGVVLLFFGPVAFRARLFPLLFLAFAIPFPDALVQQSTAYLKAGSADVVAGLFSLTRTPFYREGFRFSMATFAIEVADECSGIRSSIALLLTSLLAGHVYLRSGWKKAILVLAVLPLALIKNAVRIVSLTLLAMYVNPSFLHGHLHNEGGIVFFLLSLGLVTPLFVLLRNSEPSL
jgi:exosortase